ncbi:MSMEG_0567/Sll0786 family nitrogen starvation N-acetyltransferase [Thermodesulfobacteriota bacterium]
MKAIVCRPVQDAAELEQYYNLRCRVFVEEQGLFSDTDRDAYDEQAIHIVALRGASVVGAVRVYEESDGVYQGGRLAVEKKFRGRVGRLLVHKAVEIVQQRQARTFKALIQQENIDFFKNLKWTATGAAVRYKDKLHQMMEADLG